MFDLTEVPFSRFGSYLSISKLPGNRNQDIEEGLYLRTIHGDANNKEIFKIEPVDREGNVLSYNIETSPTELQLHTSQGLVKICFPENKIMHIKGENIGIKLYTENTRTTIPKANGDWIVNCSINLIQFLVKSLEGDLNINTLWEHGLRYSEITFLPEKNMDICEGALLEFVEDKPEGDYNYSYKEAEEKVVGEFKDYLGKMPAESTNYQDSRKLASYVNWASTVAPEGLLKRPAVLMSKNWMTNVWSWDHCFNAISLSYNYPDLAWDQYMLLFDFQSEKGKLPDSVNDYLTKWHSTKPPIHGWALKKMMNNTKYIGDKELKEIYNPLSKWTQWWFKNRDYDNDGIPEYHHGNDSGWDNSTIFIEEPPIESPDLSSFLIIQMEVLSEIADKLNRDKKAKMWNNQAENLYNKFKDHYLQNNKLKPLTPGDHKTINSKSLLQYMPIILGKRLSDEIINNLVAGIKKHLTEYGLATEQVNSKYYETDGYWRGPIWAPSTMLIVDGLRKAGKKDLAKEIIEKFAEMCAENGFAENFDAVKGKGLRDKAYTWTSSVFLILLQEYNL